MTNVLSDLRQNIGGSLPIVLSSQPSGRFVAKYETDEKAEGRERLHGQRHLPCSVGLIEGLEILVGSLKDEAN
jgi:hypothetical protein